MNKEIEISPRLKELEAIIERGLDTFTEVGNALLEIRDKRLYQKTHDTFEAYCREKWSVSRVHAHRMIKAAEITNNLLPTGNKPKTERQIRPLAGLMPAQQREIWKEAIKDANGKEPTGKQVEAAKAQTLDELVPRIKQNLAKLEAADINVDVYHVFEMAKKKMNSLKSKPAQQKFKTRLLEFLKNKLIPSTPIPTKPKGKKS